MSESVVKQILPPFDLSVLLIQKGYSKEEIASLLKKDVLFISNEKRGTPPKEVVHPHTLVLKKLLSNEKKLTVDFAVDKNGFSYLELLSAEIYIGPIIFLSTAAWDISKDFVASWLFDHYVSMKKESKELTANLEIEVIDEKKGKTFRAKYSGPANQVAKIIKQADMSE